MPAYMNSHSASPVWRTCPKGHCSKPSAECLKRSGKSLTIGLINNMPDGAFEATERQFLSLLDSSSDDLFIRVLLYSLPGIPRNEVAANRVRQLYSSVENLGEIELDGLIVTGREPLTKKLTDEPYWESFTKVLDWARDHTYSTVWSCLAAHAATLHMDGIQRSKSDFKHCGVFDCVRVSDHPLTAGTPSRLKLPHSRWNGLSEDQLTACGYRVLTRAANVGVDTFIKHDKSMFVFFQGHPEYESNTLLLEYRRDVGRYLRGETVTYPRMPQDYFDRDTVIALTELQEEAQIHPRRELMKEVSEILEKIEVENTWHSTATSIYRNWLQYICVQKRRRAEANQAASEAHAMSTSALIEAAAKGGSPSAVFATDCQKTSTIPPRSRDAFTIL
jgi:homoserine O-succinyltransferase/O-acetyltransferase